MEWKRVFCSRKRLGALLLLLVLCAAVFVYEEAGGFSIADLKETYHAGQYAAELSESWKNEEDLSALLDAEMERLWNEEPVSVRRIAVLEHFQKQIRHLTSYEAYLQRIQEQALTISQAAIFRTDGSFSNRNLEKTAKDFLPMSGTKTVFGNSLAAEAWLQSPAGDIFFLCGIVLFVFAFLEERKTGLLQVIRSCKHGRRRLTLTRLAILAAASVLCAILFSGTTLGLSALLNGGLGDLSRQVQSLDAFKTCTLKLSLGGWILRYFFLRAFFGLVTGTLLWCLVSRYDRIQFPLAILGLIAAVELASYTMLPEQSVLSFFKYCNLFSLIELSRFDTVYRNLNLFGYPIGKQAVIFAVSSALLFISAYLMLCRQYVFHSASWFEQLTGGLRKRFGLLHSRYSLLQWEAFKSLRFSFGILFLSLFLIAVLNMDFVVRKPTDPDERYAAYRNDLLGPLADSDTYFQQLQSDSASVQRLREEVSSIRQTAAAEDYEPWLVDQAAFDGVYGKYSLGRQQLHVLVSLVFVVMLCSGIGAFERQSHMSSLLRASKSGRKKLKRRKLLLAAIYAAVIWGCVAAAEFAAYTNYTLQSALSAPVKNFLRSFPLSVSLRIYLLMLYALRLLMLTAAAWLSYAIGCRCRTVAKAYLLTSAVLLLPSALTVIGLDACKWVSLIVPAVGTELLLSCLPLGIGCPVLLFAAARILGNRSADGI